MRMRRIALFTCTLFLVLTACAAQADEVVITLGGDCVLGTREEWKDDAETFDTLIAEKALTGAFQRFASRFSMTTSAWSTWKPFCKATQRAMRAARSSPSAATRPIPVFSKQPGSNR